MAGFMDGYTNGRFSQLPRTSKSIDLPRPAKTAGAEMAKSAPSMPAGGLEAEFAAARLAAAKQPPGAPNPLRPPKRNADLLLFFNRRPHYDPAEAGGGPLSPASSQASDFSHLGEIGTAPGGGGPLSPRSPTSSVASDFNPLDQETGHPDDPSRRR